jgi:hypothetical protein
MWVVKDVPEAIYGLPISSRLIANHALRTAGCLSISVEPRATRLEITPLPVTRNPETSRIGRPQPNEVLCTAYIARPEPCKSAGSY